MTRGKQTDKAAKHLKKGIKSYTARVREYEKARRVQAEASQVVVSPEGREALQREVRRLDAQAQNLKDVRELLVNACRDLGVGFEIPEVVN